MYYNQYPIFAQSNYETQLNTSSYFKENVSLPINMMQNFQMYKPNAEHSLSDYFNNLFLYENIWTPLNAQTALTKTNKTENCSPVNYQSMIIQKPVAHSTPRAIRKTLMSEENKNNFINEVNEAEKINLKPNKSEPKQTRSKFVRRNGTKGSLDSSNNSSNSFSPKSNSINGSRKLPLRSQGIDLSQYLHKNTDSGSSCASSSFSNDSCFNKFQIKDKINVQNKCLFCENNGESEEVYMSHPLKDSLGKVVCPILRNYTCPKCGESGDYAHTNKYCPETQRRQKENKIKKYFNLKD